MIPDHTVSQAEASPTPARVCPSCGARYEGTARFCLVDRAPLHLEGATGDDPLISTLVADRFYVERKLGEGGMGRVYLASQFPMNRACALKVMRTDIIALPDARARFSREALSVSRMSHANIVAVYDSGETADGTPYIAMEYVDGEPLNRTLAREVRLPPARAALILMQVAAALNAAHTNGIVHRDLKPENILLGKGAGSEDHVKVVDFGIARPVKEDTTQLTSTGVVLGTPAYMSPEQLTGERVDARSDVFSLGLVTCVMLTGQLPFPAAHTELGARLLKPPTPLCELFPGEAWPTTVQDQLNAALATNPADRPRSTLEFARNFVDTLATWRPEDFADVALKLDAIGPEVTGAVPGSLRISRRTPTAEQPRVAVADAKPPTSWRILLTLTVTAATAAALWVLRPFGSPAMDAATADTLAAAAPLSTKSDTPVVVATRPQKSGIHVVSRPKGDSSQQSVVSPPATAPSSVADTAAPPVSPLPADTDATKEPEPPPPPAEGWVLIGSRNGALLFVNDELQGPLNSLRFLRFAAGQTVTLRLRIEGCQDWDTTVTIRSDTTRVGFKGARC